MTFLRNNILFLIVAAFLGVGIIGAYYFFRGNTSSTMLVSVPDAGSGQNLLTDLSNLQTVTFDAAIFSDPGFLQLTDFNVDIPPQPVGNTDPFAPFSATAAGTVGSSVPGTIVSGTSAKSGS